MTDRLAEMAALQRERASALRQVEDAAKREAAARETLLAAKTQWDTERAQLRAALTELLGAFHGACFSGSSGESQWMSRSQWIPTVKLDAWRALVGITLPTTPAPDPERTHGD